jgi:hypothetical protein
LGSKSRWKLGIEGGTAELFCCNLGLWNSDGCLRLMFFAVLEIERWKEKASHLQTNAALFFTK